LTGRRRAASSRPGQIIQWPCARIQLFLAIFLLPCRFRAPRAQLKARRSRRIRMRQNGGAQFRRSCLIENGAMSWDDRTGENSSDCRGSLRNPCDDPGSVCSGQEKNQNRIAKMSGTSAVGAPAYSRSPCHSCDHILLHVRFEIISSRQRPAGSDESSWAGMKNLDRTRASSPERFSCKPPSLCSGANLCATATKNC
jgi:hypothetical protein